MRSSPNPRPEGASRVAWSALATALALLGSPLAAQATASPAATATQDAAPALSAEEIVERSIAARGGLAAWQKIESLAWVGHLESERLADRALSFRLTEQRPNKTRFEILGSQPSVRVFNGVHGWKMHTRGDGMPDVDSFTPLEERFAREAPGLDGPLIHARAHGRHVVLQGRDVIDGRDCYRLGIVLPSGDRQTVWVDAATFLETRFDRPTFGRDGAAGQVSVRFRDYQAQGGLQLPTVLEIGGGGAVKPDRLVIERVAVNPKLDAMLFDRPPAPPHNGHITIPPPGASPGAP